MNPSIRPRPSRLDPFARALCAGLPALDVRLRERELAVIAARLAPAAAGRTDDPTLAPLLLGELSRLQAVYREVSERRERFREAADTAPDAAAERRLVEEALRRGRRGGALRRDLRAMRRRWLDADAVLERFDARLDGLVIRVGLVVRMIAARYAAAGPPEALLPLLDHPDRPLRRVVVEALATWAVERRRRDPDTQEDAVDAALLARVDDPRSDVIVARRALRGVAARADAEARLLRRFGAGPALPDDFLVRAEVVRWLVRLGGSAAEAAVARAALDPSETVRGAAVSALLAAPDPVLRAEGRRLAVDDPSIAVASRARPVEPPEDPAVARVAALQAGESTVLRGGDPLDLARRLLPAAAGRWGFALQPLGEGRVRVSRGEREVLRAWRLRHELGHADPGKRQGGNHLTGRTWDGPIRVPSRRMAEVSPTGVPGQPVRHEAWAGWAPWLPLVDDLVDAARLGQVQLVTEEGLTTVRAPARRRDRLRAWARLAWRAAQVDRVRAAALEAADAPGRAQYLREVERLGFQVAFVPHGRVPLALLDVLPEEAPPVPAEAPALVLPPLAGEWWARAYGASDPAELAVVGAAIGVAFAGRLAASHAAVRRARRGIPLVLGGWGTRGKSGVERLKAALFEGLGVEAVCKTTGCEAMLLHNPPGRPAVELFLYRPYDRATIWEHAGVLKVGADLGAPVFLWECMALKPDYVEILQRHWTRDDASTLTNTYPDHEDVHGPTGRDVAGVISCFIPDRALAITAEAEMTSILEERAAERHTTLLTVAPPDVSQVPADLLARFPHQEHPANVALVATLARELGLDPEEAVVLMADHVVPDLGSLATFPMVRHRGRVLQYSNGSSANERTGFLNNWRRCGYGTHDPDDAGTWLVTIVNNRYDRVARSQVFAEILVRDAPAARHVLIGSNLEGLRGYVRDALERWLAELDLLGGGGATVKERLRALRRHLVVLDPGDVVRACAARLDVAGEAVGAGAALDELIGSAPARPMPLAEARQALAPVVPLLEEVARVAATRYGVAPFPLRGSRPGTETLFHDADDRAHGLADLVEHWTRLAAEALAFASARRALTTLGAPVEADCLAVFHEIFMGRLVVVEEYGATGDQVIDAVARAAPAGVVVRCMSIQNIKGTGLDFVYRWVYGRPALDRVADVGSALPATRDAALSFLAAHREWSVPILREVLGALAASGLEPADPVVVRLAGELRHREQALLRGPERKAEGWLATAWGKVLKLARRLWDPFDAILRRWHADRIFDDLAARRVSHARAAALLRDLSERGRGK